MNGRLVLLLHAVNVGGTGRLAMADLRAACLACGLHDPVTYLASGNVVCSTDRAPAEAKHRLEVQLGPLLRRDGRVAVRTAAELAALASANPFSRALPERTTVIFLDDAPPPDALSHATGRRDEEAALGRREIYVHYPSGIGRSRFKIPAAGNGTARNLRTVAALVELST